MGRLYRILLAYIGLLLFAITSVAQSTAKHPYQIYQFPKKVPSKYQFDGMSEYHSIMREKPSGISEDDYSRYAEYMAFQKQDFFLSGQVYMDWSLVEDYVNEVLKTILQKNNKSDKVRVYVLKSATPNAYAMHDGTLFITIGMLAELYNEASLAAILGHEIAHYLNKDVEESFLRRIDNTRKSQEDVTDYALALEDAHKNREQETIADSLGIAMMLDAGYDVKYAKNILYHFIEMENALRITDAGSTGGEIHNETEDQVLGSDGSLESHPAFSERLELINRRAKEQMGGSTYKVDAAKFETIKKLTQRELLNTLLEHSRLKTCASKALQFHMLDPGDPAPVYFILESIRKLLYLNGDGYNLGFLTDRDDRFETGQGVLHRIDLLMPDSLKRAAIKTTSFLDSVKPFETYWEAFEYFKGIALRDSIIPAYLSLGLQELLMDNPQGHNLIQQYIRHHDYNRPFCDALLATDRDQLTKKIKTNDFPEPPRGKVEIIILNTLKLIESHPYGLHDRVLLAAEKEDLYVERLSKMFSRKFRNSTFQNFDNVAPNNLQFVNDVKYALATSMIAGEVVAMEETEYDYEKLGTTYTFGDTKEESEKEEQEPDDPKNLIVPPAYDFNLFTYDPSLYTFFEDYKIGSIGYLNILSFTDKSTGPSWLKVLNPLSWLSLGSTVTGNVLGGSENYGYLIHYTRLKPSADEILVEEIYTVNYKMVPGHLANTVYYAVKGNQ